MYIMHMKKHYHDINLYKKLRNDGLTWRQIGQRVGIDHSTIACWINRHYEEFITYEYKKK